MLEPGQILHERYQLKQLLGKNAGRQTWLSEDLASISQKLVIVKLLAFGGEIQWDDLKLFEREAQILKQLSHPRIPKYHDYFSIDDKILWFGLVHEYIPGKSLKEKLEQGKRFTETEVRKIAIEVLQILIYLHGLNPQVLHRDIKPSNLIWSEDNQIYVVDFGAVQDRAAKEGATFTVVGTYGYAPIEQFGGRAVPSSDLYALGATLIHLLTGTAPADLPQLNLKIQFADRINLTANLINWLEQLTEPALEKRFSSAKIALEELESGILHPRAVLPPLASIKASGQGFNSKVSVPEEILGWNWGAFLLAPLWPFSNRVWIGLLTWIPHFGWVMAWMLGAKGNEWAWKSKKWRSIEQFKAHQRGWAIAGIMVGIPVSLAIWALLFGIITSIFHF